MAWWRILVLSLVVSLQPVVAAPLPFPVAEVQRVQGPVERVLEGVVEPVNRSTVSAQVVGRIEEIHFDVDDRVPQGSVLIRFRSREQRAALEQAQAEWEAAKARVQEASLEYQRVKNLFDRDLVSRSERDRAEATWETAQAQVALTKARIAQAQERLDNTVVRAPFSGIVEERHVEVGETVRIGQPLMTGFALKPLRVVTHVPQNMVDEIRQRRRARVFRGAKDHQATSTQLTIFPYADRRTHTVKVRVRLPDESPAFYPGTLVKVAFELAETARLLVPAEAVVQRSEVTGVYVVDSATGEVALRRIATGKPYGDKVEVLAGLREGETVALEPIAAGIYLKEQRNKSLANE